ncbi:hypothetical protein [Rhizobium sp. GN54]|uniref:hypothetical protein n=1 Tax=Rhizobium sp. GN54 TaxID=2898150 RepID=UPI001E607DC7|nr:hypothetical protein [Rhizobium sp. GN54]MCD2181260.1 hypothetical protein [Rhizobium sp. GN54]
MARKLIGNIKTAVRWIQLILFNVIAVIFLALSFLLLFEDRAAAATVAASVAVGLLVICYIPILDSFEIFGLKAKLRLQVSEADRALEALRNYATVSSKILSDQFKWSRIMAAPTLDQTADWYESLNRSLEEMHVDEAQLRRNQQPFLDYLSWQLFNIFERVAIERTQERMTELRKEMQSTNSVHLATEIDALSSSLETDVRHFDDPALRSLSVKIEHRIGQLRLDQDDVRKLREFARDLIRLSDELQATRSVGAETRRLLDEYEMDVFRWKRDFYRVFGREA